MLLKVFQPYQTYLRPHPPDQIIPAIARTVSFGYSTSSLEMPRANQIIIRENINEFECIPCNRAFGSRNALLQHCQNSSSHRYEWCNRCDWLFVSNSARQEHFDHSMKHWICQFCEEDETSRSALIDHLEDVHNYCYDCEMHFSNWTKHRSDYHHRCAEYGREFQSQNNLTMVSWLTKILVAYFMPGVMLSKPRSTNKSTSFAIKSATLARSCSPKTLPSFCISRLDFVQVAFHPNTLISGHSNAIKVETTPAIQMTDSHTSAQSVMSSLFT